ncbi:FkbM family methyltransferase, partial [bacterium]|nr:FkbM family methyltransferase [bacterium]
MFINLVRFVKRIIRVALRRDILVLPDYRGVKFNVLGSDYGCWPAVESVLSGDNPIVYSFGVGDDVTFDEAIIQKYSVNIYAFDPTPKSIDWVESRNMPDGFYFHKIGLSDHDGIESFSAPVNKKHISYRHVPGQSSDTISLEVRKLSTILHQAGHNKLDVLKMDIEGSEYAVIKNIFDEGIKPIVLLVEFHHRLVNFGISQTKDAISILKNEGYGIFYVSP